MDRKNAPTPGKGWGLPNPPTVTTTARLPVLAPAMVA